MTVPEAVERRGSIPSAINWMGGLSLLLFWLPGVGPFIAGLVGGTKAGSVKRALIATFLPVLLTGAMAAAGVAYLTQWWPWGLLAGLGGIAISLINIVPLLAGAIIGGILSRFVLR